MLETLTAMIIYGRARLTACAVTSHGLWTGTVDGLAEVLRRCVKYGGRSFVRYSEEASVHASNLDTTVISEHHFVLLQFHMISEQLMFNKSLMVAAFADRLKGRMRRRGT